MKKIVNVIMVFFIVLASSLSNVFAEDLEDLYDDTQYYGSFFGTEYPIINTNPDIMPLYDVSGFSVASAYKDDSGSFVSYNQAVTLPNTKTRQFYITVTMPELIERGQSIDCNLSLLFNSATVSPDSVTVFDSLWHSYMPDVTVSSANVTSSSAGYTYTGINCPDYTIKYVRFYYTVKPTTTNFSFYLSGVSVTKASDSALLGQLSAQMEMLIYLVQNNIVGSLTSLLHAWTTYLEVLPVWLEEHCSHIVDGLNSVKSAVNTIGSNIVSSITSMCSTLSSKIVSAQNAIVTKLDDTLVVKDKTDIDNTNKSNSDLESGFSDYNDLENGMVDDFNSSMDNIDTDMKLYSDNDFIASAQFVSTNLQNIYDSNIYIAYVVDFALIMGIALTLIGIKVRR